MQSHNKDNSQYDETNYLKILSSNQSLDDKIKSYLNSVFMIDENQIKDLIKKSKEKKIQNLDDIIKIFSSRGNFSFDDSLEVLIENSETKKIQNLDDILKIYIKSKRSYYERMKFGDNYLISDELKILINNSKTRKAQNLKEIIEDYLYLTHYFIEPTCIVDGINRSNYFFKIHINETLNILLENSNNKPQEKIEILRSSIALLENNQHKETITDVLMSKIKLEEKKIPDPIQKFIKDNKIKFYIKADNALAKDNNDNLIVQIAYEKEEKVQLWSKASTDNRNEYNQLAKKFYNSCEEHINKVENKKDQEKIFEYISGMPEITFYKDSKYYSQLTQSIKLKKEDEAIKIDVGNNKKNKYTDITKIITRILIHTMKQEMYEKVDKNLEIYDIKKVKNDTIPLGYSTL